MLLYYDYIIILLLLYNVVLYAIINPLGFCTYYINITNIFINERFNKAFQLLNVCWPLLF